MSTFLLKNRKPIYTRIFIPKVLRTFFRERIEVWKSLRTVDREEAPYHSSKWRLHAKRLFRTLHQHGKYMTKDQIEALVSIWLESELEDFEKWRDTYGLISEHHRTSSKAGVEASSFHG